MRCLQRSVREQLLKCNHGKNGFPEFRNYDLTALRNSGIMEYGFTFSGVQSMAQGHLGQRLRVILDTGLGSS